MQRTLSNGAVVPSSAPATAGALVDRSGTIAVGGSAQTLMAANPTRLGWKLQNLSGAPLYFNESGVASAGAGSFMLAPMSGTTPGGYYESPPGGQPFGAISVFGGNTGQAFTAEEW